MRLSLRLAGAALLIALPALSQIIGLDPSAFGSATWRESVESIGDLPACSGKALDTIRLVRSVGLHHCPPAGGEWTLLAGGSGGSGDVTGVGSCGSGPCFSNEPSRFVFAAPDGGGVAGFRALGEADIADLDHCTPAPDATYFVSGSFSSSKCPYCDANRCQSTVAAAVTQARTDFPLPARVRIVLYPEAHSIESLAPGPLVDIACLYALGPSTSTAADPKCRMVSSQPSGDVYSMQVSTLTNVSVEGTGTPTGDINIVKCDLGACYGRNVDIQDSYEASPHVVRGVYATGSTFPSAQFWNLSVQHFKTGTPSGVSVEVDQTASLVLWGGWLNDHGSVRASAVKCRTSQSCQLNSTKIGAKAANTFVLPLDCEGLSCAVEGGTSPRDLKNPPVGTVEWDSAATSDVPGHLQLAGDLTGPATAPQVAPDAVELGTDTTGGYAGSATEGGPATTALELDSDPAGCSPGDFVVDVDADGTLTCATPSGGGGGGATDHGALSGLPDDDHSQYTLFGGRPGGQSLSGGIAAGESLTLFGTSHGTPGDVFLGAGRFRLPGTGSNSDVELALDVDGDTGFACIGDDACFWIRAGGYQYEFGASYFGTALGSSGFRIYTSSSATSPMYSVRGDVNTGLGFGGNDNFFGVAGGVSAFTASEALSVATTTIHDAFRLEPQSSPPLACSAATLHVLYGDDSVALCWCDGTSWQILGGPGSCS